MGTIFVARSTNLSKWGSDVGLSKHIYKLGYTEGSAKDAIAAGWAGEADWTLVKKQDDIDAASEDALIDRLARKDKMIDPNLYPRIKGTRGIFKVPPAHVENDLVVASAMAGDPLREIKVKHPDFAAYMIANALA